MVFVFRLVSLCTALFRFLFSDAEPTKNISKNFVGGYLAGYGADVPEGLAQIF